MEQETGTKFGAPIAVDPAVALLEEVHRSAGHVAWLRSKLNELEESWLVWSAAQETHEEKTGEADENNYELSRRDYRAQVNQWWQLYTNERKHLAAVSQAAVKVGIEERQVRIMERTATAIEQVIVGLLQDLGHDPYDMAVRQVVGARMAQLVPQQQIVDMGEVSSELELEPLARPDA